MSSATYATYTTKSKPFSTWWMPLVLVAIGFLPILSTFFRQQWQRPEYQAFPLMFAAAAIFLYQRHWTAKPRKRLYWPITIFTWICALGSLGLLAASFFVFSPWLAMVAFELFVFAAFLTIWRDWQLRGLWQIWLLIALLLPPPLDRDQMFIDRLQLFSSKLTSMVLDQMGVLHLMQGNTLSFMDRQLFVDEACSGIVSLISILYCICIYCVWQNRSMVHMLVLMAIGVVATVVMNTFRLTSIALAWYWMKWDWASGMPHTILAIVLLVVINSILLAIDRFLLEVFSPIDVQWRKKDTGGGHVGLLLMNFWDHFIASEEDDEEAIEEMDESEIVASVVSAAPVETPRTFTFPSVISLPVTSLFAMLGVSYLLFFGWDEADKQRVVDESLTRAFALSEETDPCRDMPGFVLLDFSSERRELFRWDDWGQYSRSYSYQDARGVDYLVSCDFLFGPHWHDLRECYQGSGWKVVDEKVIPHSELGELPHTPVVVESSLTAPWMIEQFGIERRGSVERGLITYGAFRADGVPVNRPRGNGLVADFWAHVVQGRDRAEQADYFQVQVTIFYTGELSELQVETAEKCLKMAIDRFKAEICAKADNVNDARADAER